MCSKKANSALGKKIFEIFNIVYGVRQSRPIWLCLIISFVATLSVYFVFKLGLKVPMNFEFLYI